MVAALGIVLSLLIGSGLGHPLQDGRLANSPRAAVAPNCPLVRCLAVACLESVQTVHYINVTGHLCPGCPVCHPTPISVCPIYKCLDVAFNCVDGVTTSHYVNISGHMCPACPVCQKTHLTTAATHPSNSTPAIHRCPAMMCPAIACLGTSTPHYVNVSGHLCLGCPVCHPKPISVCPIYECVDVALNCVDGVMTTHYVNISGHKCPRCPVCQKTHLTTAATHPSNSTSAIHRCPAMMCPAIACLGTSTPHYVNVSGHLCLGCPVCHPKPISVCPLLRCAMLACLDGVQTTHYVNRSGVLCPGCPVCHRTPVTAVDSASHSVLKRADCPIFHCPKILVCTGGLQQTYIDYNGHNCTACPTCAPNIFIPPS